MSDAQADSGKFWPPSIMTLKIDANAKGEPCFNLTEFGLGLRSQIDAVLFGPGDGTNGLTVVMRRTFVSNKAGGWWSVSLTHKIRNVGGHDATDHIYDSGGNDQGRMLYASWFKSGEEVCFIGTFPPSRADKDMIDDFSKE